MEKIPSFDENELVYLHILNFVRHTCSNIIKELLLSTNTTLMIQSYMLFGSYKFVLLYISIYRTHLSAVI